MPEVVLAEHHVEDLAEPAIIVATERCPGGRARPRSKLDLALRVRVDELTQAAVGLSQRVKPKGQPLGESRVVAEQAEGAKQASVAAPPYSKITIGELVEARVEPVLGGDHALVVVAEPRGALGHGRGQVVKDEGTVVLMKWRDLVTPFRAIEYRSVGHGVLLQTIDESRGRNGSRLVIHHDWPARAWAGPVMRAKEPDLPAAILRRLQRFHQQHALLGRLLRQSRGSFHGGRLVGSLPP